MNAEDFIKLDEYIKENYVPKEGSSDKCFEDYLYAILKDIQINLDEIARSIKKISGDDKDPTSILDIDVEV